MLPTGSVWIPAGESLPVSVTASPGATVRLRRPGGFILTLSADSNAAPVASGLRAFDRDERNLVRRGLGDRYVGVLRDIPPEPSAPLLGTQSPPIGTRGWQVEVIVGDDTVRQAWPLAIRTTSAPIAVVLDDDRAKRGDTDRTTIGRTTPGGTYAWFFPAGTHAQADARIGNDVRLRLSRDAIAWVPIEEVHRRPASDDPRPARMGALTLTKDSEYTRLRIPLSHPVPLQVEQEFDRITVRLFGAFGDADWTRYDSGPDFVRLLSWRQSSSDQVELVAAFDRPLWGWRVRVDNSDLVLDFREPPVIDASNPLRGRNVVVDAGHPPLGACGPSGACESELNLLIAQQVDKRLRDAGARVTMTRADSSPVGLSRRVAIADSVGAEILVSIHNNALPDGVNPFTNSGSSTFFNHPNSIGLARAVQEQMVRNFGTRDLGVARGDLALVRPTWYPAILTEGLFMMIPRHEAALLSRAGQAKYADAVVDGIAEWLRGAQRSPSGGARQ